MKILLVWIFLLSSLKAVSEPLFVSLGSNCEVAMQLRNHNVRTVAFPFDWLLTPSLPLLSLLLEEDFSSFLHPDDLIYLPSRGIVNTRYQIYFRHEKDLSFLVDIQTKYERRIQRFRALKHYEGKVYFLRAANGPGRVNPSTIITPLEACNLYETLQKQFPKLHFQLIIINYLDNASAPFPSLLGIREFKTREGHETLDYSKILRILK